MHSYNFTKIDNYVFHSHKKWISNKNYENNFFICKTLCSSISVKHKKYIFSFSVCKVDRKNFHINKFNVYIIEILSV